MISRHFVTPRESSAHLGKDILEIERPVTGCVIAPADFPGFELRVSWEAFH